MTDDWQVIGSHIPYERGVDLEGQNGRSDQIHTTTTQNGKSDIRPQNEPRTIF